MWVSECLSGSACLLLIVWLGKLTPFLFSVLVLCRRPARRLCIHLLFFILDFICFPFYWKKKNTQRMVVILETQRTQWKASVIPQIEVIQSTEHTTRTREASAMATPHPILYSRLRGRGRKRDLARQSGVLLPLQAKQVNWESPQRHCCFVTKDRLWKEQVPILHGWNSSRNINTWAHLLPDAHTGIPLVSEKKEKFCFNISHFCLESNTWTTWSQICFILTP